jgi:hypothetical protein
MVFDTPDEEEKREPGASSAMRRAQRLAWLASVRSVLTEATALVDAIAAEGVDTEKARARLIPARAAIEALRATLGGSGGGSGGADDAPDR